LASIIVVNRERSRWLH